jgi:hypothetical protein
LDVTAGDRESPGGDFVWAGSRNQILEEQIIAELREWLDAIEDRYGPSYALENYGFVGGVGFTPEGEEPDGGDSFGWSAVSFHFSDSRQWAQVGLLRKALLMAESDED